MSATPSCPSSAPCHRGSLSPQPRIRAAFTGIHPTVADLLLAALWKPVITSGMRDVGDVVLVGVALVALMHWKWQPWVAVAGCARVEWEMPSIGYVW